LILALVALGFVIYEIGRLAVEAWQRSQRPTDRFDNTARHALAQAHAGDTAGAQATLRSYAYGDALQRAAVGTLFAISPIDAQRAVVDYDLYVSKRLDRVRLLVRAGPALGLMGTLIPLAPALAALGKGQPSVLAGELQTAFAITVVGVAVGLIAFTVALVRERYYTKDLADLEFLREIRGDASQIAQATAAQPSAAAPSHQGATDQPTAVSPSLNPAAAAVAGAAPGVPPMPPQPKKKFGLRRKSPDAPPSHAFPPPPPAPAPTPAPAPAPSPEPPAAAPAAPAPSASSDKAASIPDAPAPEQPDASDGPGGPTGNSTPDNPN
jgi:biopolymer transport protein ExbB/TolQ